MSAGAQHSILVVEDEIIVAMDLQAELRELGYDAFATAASADEAIACAAARCPDLVLMDIRIKGDRDGIQAAELLKTRFDVPVVFLTSHADDQTVDRAKKVGPHGYLLKPWKAAELKRTVELALYKHEMEKRLRERERWFATTMKSIADAVITVDLTGKVTFMNPAAEALTGTTSSSAIGRPVRDVMRISSSAEAGTEDLPIVTALREGRTVELIEGTLKSARGAPRTINDIAAPVVDGPHALGAVMVFRDVTEQKKLQQQLELADRLTSLGTMAAGVAHEINNPLAAILANTEYVAAGLKTLVTASQGEVASMYDAVLDARAAAQRVGKIVSDLRSFSRPQERTRAEAHVESVVDWAVRMTAHELRHRARLVRNHQPAPAMNADDAKLGQVLINLLMNAAHAIEPGRVEQNEIRIDSRPQGARVLIEVRDTGKGIPADILPRIFEPFFTTKPIGLGTGLGLSICRGIVSSFGGEITVESEVGKGTIFRVSMPAIEPAPASRAKTPALRRANILLLDDDQTISRALRRALSEHEVSCVSSETEALKLIDADEKLDVILSELLSSEVSGRRFYETVLEKYPELARKIIFMSGRMIAGDLEDFLRTVPNRFIEKPFDLAELKDAVNQLLLDR